MNANQDRKSRRESQANLGAVDRLIRKHREQMQNKKFPVYRLFDPIDAAALTDQDRTALRREAAQLVELAILHRATSAPKLEEIVKAIIARGMPQAREAFAAWRDAATQAARASTRSLKAVLEHFGDWLAHATAANAAVFCEALPRLAPCLGELDEREVTELLRAAGPLAPEPCAKMLGCVAEYGWTSVEIVSAMARLARSALRWDQLALLEKLVAVVRPARVMNHRDSRRLIPAAAHLSDLCHQLGSVVWRHGFNVILALASRNASSAYIAARDLPKRMGGMPADVAAKYLEDIERLVEAMGVGVSWFGIDELPRLYNRHGFEVGHAFAAAAAAAAEAYGPTAGWWFLQRKTLAGQQVLAGETR